LKRASIRSVIENPQPEKYYYVLVTRYYPRYLRMHGLKISETPIAVWDRELAPSKELLKDYKEGKISWKEYEERFKKEVPKEFVKQRLKEYQRKAQGKEVVLVCIEEDWEYPHCHTWILLDIWKHDPNGLEPEKPSGKRVLIKGFDTEREAREWVKTEKALAKKLGRKPHYYEVEKAISPLGTEVWYVYQILEEKKHWLFHDLPEKPKKPLRATLEPWIEAARVKELTEFVKEKPKLKIEEWHLVFAPHLAPHIYDFHYKVLDHWDSKSFDSFDEVKDFLKKGKATLYVHALRTKEEVSWTPIDLPKFRFDVGDSCETENFTYTLEQPYFSSVENRWIWRVSVWDKSRLEGKTIEMSEDEWEKLKSKAKPVKESIEDFFSSMNWKPLAVGDNFKWKCKQFRYSRPPSTDPASLGRLSKAIEEGMKDPYSGEDYSKKALIWDEKDYMYYIVECLEEER